jgi:hypothetical protein
METAKNMALASPYQSPIKAGRTMSADIIVKPRNPASGMVLQWWLVC